jgi:hypothetical protein
MIRISIVVVTAIGLAGGCKSQSAAPEKSEPAREAAPPRAVVDVDPTLGTFAADAPRREPARVIGPVEAEPIDYTASFRSIRRRSATLDRDVGTISTYLPTFEGAPKDELSNALRDIEARRIKLKKDVEAMSIAGEQELRSLVPQVEQNLDALELEVARALVKAREPGGA